MKYRWVYITITLSVFLIIFILQFGIFDSSANYNMSKIFDKSDLSYAVEPLKDSIIRPNQIDFSMDSYWEAKFQTINEFRDFCQEVHKKNILLFDNSTEQMPSGTIRAYLYKPYKKSLFTSIFNQYNDWVLIFKLEYENNRLYYSTSWNEGNGIDVFQLRPGELPPKRILVNKQKIISSLESELKAFINNP